MPHTPIRTFIMRCASFLAGAIFVMALHSFAYAQQGVLTITMTLPQTFVDHAYTQVVSIDGGVGPYVITEAGTLPPGLAWHDFANGSKLTGMPSVAGTFEVTVTVMDAIGEKAVQSGVLTVGIVQAGPLDSPNSPTKIVTEGMEVGDHVTMNTAPTVEPSTIPNGTVGIPYATQTFGNLDYTTNVSLLLFGGLPKGMSAVPNNNSTLTLSGTPLESGSFPISVFIADPVAHTSTTTNYTLVIAPATPLSIVVSPSFSGVAQVGSPITPTTFSPAGGSGDVSIFFSGTVQNGLYLTQGTLFGIPQIGLSGTPTQEGQFEFTFTVVDNVTGATYAQKFSLNALEPVRVPDPSSAPQGTVGQFYLFIASATPTAPNYTVQLFNLPPGLTVSYTGSTAVLGGTPTKAGSYLMAVEGTDQYGNTDLIGVYTVVIQPAPIATIMATGTPAAPTYSDANTVSFALTGNKPTVPTGTISFSLDGGAAQAYPIVSGGLTLALGRQPAGTHTLNYSYSGDAIYPALTGQIYGFSVAVPPYSVVGAQTTIASISSSNVAVDASDNVYYPNFYDNNIYKIDTQGNTTLIPTSGLNSPQGMRFDAAGNLYICDALNSRIVMLTPAGVQTVVPMTGLNQPRFLAFDAGFQHLYVSDRYAGILMYNLASQQTTVYATNLFRPEGVAVDAQGDVYYGDGDTLVKNGAAFSTAIGEPDGMLFDRAGNLYVVGDGGLSRVNPHGVVTQMADEAANDIAIDSHGILYLPSHNSQHMLAYTSGPNVWGGRNAAFVGGRIQYQYANGMRAYYSTPSGVTLNSVAIPTGGSPYIGDTGPTCFSSTLCGANLSLGAFLPGQQPGYSVATFSDGTQTSNLLYGTGIQVEIGFTPGSTSQTTTGVTFYGGAANDLSGGVYVSDTVSNKVLKVAGGSVAPVAFTGLNSPTQLAVDGAKSLYVLDSGSQRIYKLDATGKQTVAFDLSEQGALLPTALTSLQSFALDGAGDLYLGGVSSAGTAIIEFYGAAGNSSIYATLANIPLALAFDAYGTLYVDDAQGAVGKFDHFGNLLPLASGLPAASSMAIEPSGTIYLANNTSPMLTQIPPNGPVAPYRIAGVNVASVVTADNYGNLTVGDNSNQMLTFNDRTTQPYNFGNVAVGTSSTIHQTLVNVGNQNGMAISSVNGDNKFTVDPGTTTCVAGTTVLLAGVTCEVGVTFAPDSLISYTNSGSVYIPLPTAFFSVTAASLPFTGSGVNSVPVANAGGPYSGTVGTAVSFSGLASTDSKGEALTYAWTFGDGTTGTGATPTHTYIAAQTFPITLTVTNTDGTTAAATTTAAITQSYAVSLTPTGYDFGNIAETVSATKDFTLANTGATSITITRVVLAPESTNSYSYSTNCLATLAAGTSCTYTVAYKPTGPGSSSTTLNITDDAGTQTASFTGSGLPLTATLAPAIAAFGNIVLGNTATQVLTLTNTSSASFGVSSVQLSNATDVYSVSNNCMTLPLGGSCSITVTFAPVTTNASGATLTVIDAAGIQTATITGTGITVPLTASPVNVDLGDVPIGSVVSHAFTITNLASQPTSYIVHISGQTPAPVIGLSGCASPIPANATCILTVTYQATGGTGSSNTVIEISTGQTGAGLYLTANNILPLTISPSVVNFGDVPTGSISTHTFTVANLSNQPTPYTVQTLLPASAPVVHLSGCASPIPANTTCTLTLTYQATVNGSANATVALYTGTIASAIQLTANGITPLTISPSTFDFGSVPIGNPVTHSFTVANLSNQPTAYMLQTLLPANSPPSIAVSGCATPVPASSTCTLTVIYRQAASGASNSIVALYTDASDAAALNLTGNGTPPLTISPLSYDFGNVRFGTSATTTMTVTNLSTLPTSFQILTYDANQGTTIYTSSGCPATLAGLASCTLTVVFTPASYSSIGGTVQLVCAGNSVISSLTGIGVAGTPKARSQVMVVGSSSLATLPTDGSTAPTSSSGGGTGAAVDASGNLLSIDTTGSTITRFSDIGTVTGTLTGNGLTKATALALDGLSTLWVVNGNGTISVFDSSGAAIGTTPLTASGTLSKPSSVNVDASGSLWIANAGNNTVTEVIGIAAPAPVLVNGVVNATPGTRP